MEAPLLETLMIMIPALHLPLRDWLLEGPLSAQVPAYVASLKRGGYAPHTCERNLNALAHFAHWLEMCHLPVHILDEGCVTFHHIQASRFSAHRSHLVFGINEPMRFRHI